MAKLTLKFEQSTIQELRLPEGASLTIGRLPDNHVQIDNLAVSGHHARVMWDKDHFCIEDSNSLNGTFVNGKRIARTDLKNGDQVMVGKHMLLFEDETQASELQALAAAAAAAAAPFPQRGPVVPKLEETVVLKPKEMRPFAVGGGGAAVAPALAKEAKERVGTLAVVDGKTDEKEYVLNSKLSVIGKSEMASIKLTGWFAPKVAAVINKREGRYFIAPSEKGIHINVNHAAIQSATELNDGDLVEVAGVKMSFGYRE